MKIFRKLRTAVLIAGWQCLLLAAAAQTLPVEIRQDLTRYNLQSTNGMPLSSTVGTPYGSDGRAPSPGSGTIGTSNQFSSLVQATATVIPDPSNLATGVTFSVNVQNLNIPRSANNSIILLSARVGAPFISRGVSFLFGAIVPPPEIDEYGVLLSIVNTNISPNRPISRPEDYWLTEPYHTNDHKQAGYYWSPHAQSVFAVNAGPLDIAWRKTLPSIPIGTPQGVFITNLDSGTYTVFTNRYIISGSAVKEPRKIYWTEGVFRSTGKPVVVPTARIGAVNVVYNNNFPEKVAQEYQGIGQVPITNPTNTLQELRTLWYDASFGQILAYNKEGRAFLELLGDTKEDNETRQHLGFEIVDVIRQPNPHTVTNELGERITAFSTATEDDSHLYPEPIIQLGLSFTYRRAVSGTDRPEYYAIRETRNVNDLQIHWLESGLEGLKWPSLLVRYRLVWPDDIAKYSHYVRPLVQSFEDARLTSVALPSQNAPIIDYQDPFDQPRARLTERFEFYTYLTPQFANHRTLLRFTSGDKVTFERVFSWLDENLKTTNFTGTVATNLASWDSMNATFDWPDSHLTPRVIHQTVNVGDRIYAPIGEEGAGSNKPYLAGYIREEFGNAYNVNAYLNPFVGGFELANVGAIIPVNARPGSNYMEVWWFRSNQPEPVPGFDPILWPSVIGRYTIQWPENASELILASNDGSGPLLSLQAKGKIYYQNDDTLPGFNPNEEHALMQGGQVYALRDDLNITTNGPGFSSEPYVLLDYFEADSRPAMRAFKVLREKRSAGIRFDYTMDAGSIIQPPMPLPLLEKPLAPNLIGQPPLSLNNEIGFWNVSGVTTGLVSGVPIMELATDQPHYFPTYNELALQSSAQPPSTPFWFYPTNVGEMSLQGVLSEHRPLELAAWTGDQPTEDTRLRYGLDRFELLTLSGTVVLSNPDEESTWAVTIVETNLADAYLEVDFGMTVPTQATNSTEVVIPFASTEDMANWRLASQPLPPAITDAQLRNFYASFTLQDRKGNTWVYRGPMPQDPRRSPFSRPRDYLMMQFYYKTLPGFFFPTRSLVNQPPVGTVTPYLRPKMSNGEFAGDPIFGNQDNDRIGDRNSLAIIYRPAWPDNVPVLQMAETLTTPKRGLPAMRGQSSLQIVYQESQIESGLSGRSAVLHDPTREKVFVLASPDSTTALNDIPASVNKQIYKGKTYFPNLPPHLAERFFFDPNRGEFGGLVFAGQFVDAPVGDKYVMLNVIGQQDADYLKALCVNDDPKKALWDEMITSGLATMMELFVENPAVPGTYIASSGETRLPHELSEVHNDDVAVDSYALTAVGPGIGYVSLISGNGLAFTPPGDPVSIQIVKVVPTLYRGEVNIIESSNPLNERLTMQQVVDLAGQIQDYTFEWKIASPVDGLPPTVYVNTPTVLMGSGPWTHLRFPRVNDNANNAHLRPVARLFQDVTSSVAPVGRLPFIFANEVDGRFYFGFNQPHGLVMGNKLTLRGGTGVEIKGTVGRFSVSTNLYVDVDPNQVNSLTPSDIVELFEAPVPGIPQSILFREFNVPAGNFSQLWLSMDLDSDLGAKLYIDGHLLVSANRGDDDTPTTSAPGALSPLSRVYKLPVAALAGGQELSTGEKRHLISVELYSQALPGAVLDLNVHIEALEAVDVTDDQWLPLDSTKFADGVRAILGGSADVRSLSDNYLIMRYQANSNSHASWQDDGSGGNLGWSQWTDPALAEGWIKRVLKGINPFNQRVADLFNNQVNTDVSIVAQAGPRWEGDVALNLDTINESGLIEIYETVLKRGKMLSINGGINFGPANDALLLAAGYLNDLYMMLGNEAWADAANPTIGIGTKDSTYGNIATALFAFRGQLSTLLDEELALLRGRDDFLLPGVELRPVYNRMIWNYTRGIDAGEVIYALNYNILDQDANGVVDADDARKVYPQGHGDAYGHYLTALKGYYTLLLDDNFDWVPRIEAVTVLGKAVSVDYVDERKFAASAAAVARTGKQIFDLTWRKDYMPGKGNGWSHLSNTRANTTTRSVPTTREWGLDHWASRAGQGAYLNWVVGNAILPDVDPDPSHEGIQKIDRTTVSELKELVSVSESLQTAMDNAEAGLTPLGLPESTIPFDINPNVVVGAAPTTHFEQIYARAKVALNNALAAFDDAKDVTRLMRSEEDSLADLRNMVNQQELAYTNALIKLYGTPYPEDIGPGKTYRTGFNGPDTMHYMYVDTPELAFPGMFDPAESVEWKIDTQTFTPNWVDSDGISDFNFIVKGRRDGIDGLPNDPAYEELRPYVVYNLSPHGFFQKPASWTGRRASPGDIQQGISGIIKARNNLYQALYNADGVKYDLDWAIKSLERKRNSHQHIRDWQTAMTSLDQVVGTAQLAYDIFDKVTDQTKDQIKDLFDAFTSGLPTSFIAGLAAGGDITAPARAALDAAGVTVKSVTDWVQVGAFIGIRSLQFGSETFNRWTEFEQIAPEQWNQELRDATTEIRSLVYGTQNQLREVNLKIQELDDARRNYRRLVADGDRIQEEREIFRQRSAAVIQGYRTRDAAFRIFRNEKLERYKALFDLASQYAFMAAQAYDYETGLLHTDDGKEFVRRIINSRALGVMQDGEPMFAGSNTGDPGLSSAMAEMFADWQVLKGRLGFNNPDGYGTTLSLRTEHLRILPGTDGDEAWTDMLQNSRKNNLLDDQDVRRYCMQINNGTGLPVPGFIIEFSTTIADGANLFGRQLAAGDHTFNSSSFATKIFSVGVALEGYRGMDDPSANGSSVQFAGGTSPNDPSLAFLDPLGLAATPYIYLIPVGVDSMRSPPLGDSSVVRSWNVDDVTVPLPFNIGGSDYSTKPLWQTRESLTEDLFAIRKHQAFRPVSSASYFTPNIYGSNGSLAANQFTNRRLIGRSVWNSRWKLVIPGHNLLNDPNEGIERFMRSVKDVKIHYVTYSYAGN